MQPYARLCHVSVLPRASPAQHLPLAAPRQLPGSGIDSPSEVPSNDQYNVQRTNPKHKCLFSTDMCFKMTKREPHLAVFVFMLQRRLGLDELLHNSHVPCMLNITSVPHKVIDACTLSNHHVTLVSSSNQSSVSLIICVANVRFCRQQ